ncbi:ankyrin repeat domain-containing protein [Wolbachia endosymbiont of Nilaparvata lugens]|uniref:ankyrin repeat domain-containing protein n=1 Tax=Wolbachia endosymbiont of Nilaparvata lugens TaxID=357143 RepID=UPI001180B0C6|nr:ankyrin repeat domain-containing protein [Wolbachia endosymbiont of Nilaparvata lugens]
MLNLPYLVSHSWESPGSSKQISDQFSLISEQDENTLSMIGLDLPEGFTIGKATNKGDCFFHAVAQGLKHIKPDMNFTVRSLRDMCKAFAQSQLNLDSSWLVQALKNDKKDINYYISFIEFTEDDMKKGHKVINKEVVLTTSMWGLPEIEGRIICTAYDVRLHFIEVGKTCDEEDVITHHIINREGYQNGIINSEILNKEVYYRKDTVHIINKGRFHFEPILRGTAEQMLSYYSDTMDSEKKSDSEFVCFQQISEVEMKDVIDNQIDYEYYKESGSDMEVLPAESIIEATVGYKDRLSNEELQYKQSRELQESPVSSRVADSSSIDSDSVWHSALTNCRSTVGTANDTDLTDYEIVKRAALFVKTFVEKFERKLSEFSEEAKPGSKIKKKGKILGQVDSIVKSAVPPGVRVIPDKVIEFIDCLSAKEHKKRAKSASAKVRSFEDETRKILVDASLEIFQKFERQFTKIMDNDQLSWERGIEKLAIDAVDRVMNYILANKEVFSIDLVTKGIVLGESKKQSLFALYSGYQVKDKQSNEILITSKIYGNAGIKREYTDAIDYYEPKECSYAKKCGYRLPFIWELEEWDKEIELRYVFTQSLEERNEYILDEEKKRRLASSILEEINANDPIKRRDIEELSEKVMEMCGKKEDKNTHLFVFNLGPLSKLFIKRRRMLVDLASMLDKESQELEMSRTVLISGGHGTGKSELARSYGYDRKNGTWKNIIWIDAETPSTLLSSFHSLAQELEISIEKGKGIQRIDVKVKTEMQQERKIKSIVEDVYKSFRDAKSLFIFDNASNYKDIEEFLPSYFFSLFIGKEKPYVFITSCSKNWIGEIEKIVLDNGFTLPEAIDFIETALGVDGRLCNADLITKLAKTLHYHPLALKEATNHIKEEGVSISQYLERYNEKMQKSNLDDLKAQNISPELFITLKVNCDKIKEEKDIGQRSNDILAFMAYLSPGKIDTAEFFFQEESEKDQQSTSDALNLLDKFSVIELEESIARVHMGIQKTIRLEKEQAGTEEEVLRRVMTSFMDSGTTSVSHIISAWSHASKYDKLVNEFIDSIYDGGTILHLLAKDGNEEVIKLILEKVDSNRLSKIVNAVDKMKFTPLDCAAMHGHLGIVKYFIEKGSDLDGDLTPLHWAAVCGQLEVVEYFIDNEYWGVDKLSRESATPLHYAVISGNMDIVKYLVEKGANVNLQDESAGPLHHAVEENRLDIVKYLVEKARADMNLKDKADGMSPLHYAIVNGHMDIVQYLVKAGVDINQQDESAGFLHYAVEEDRLDIIECLVTHGADVNLKDKVDGMSPLHYAIKNDFLDISKYLITHGADVNLKDKDNMSSLDYANKSDRSDIVKYLIRRKAVENLCQKNGVNSLYYGTESGRLDIAKYLLKKKISIILNQSDEIGISSFYYANLYGRLDSIKSLIIRSTIVDPRNKEDVNSLHLAVIFGYLDTVDYLVTNGANVNEQDKEGMSPLHIAVACGHSDIIDYLVANRANVDEQNKEGLSPLHIAVIHGHLGSVKYLVEKGADINLKDKYSISPLLYALTITIDRPDIASCLIKYSSFVAQEVNVESEFKNLLHNNAPGIIYYPEAQSSALDLRVQSHKRHQKRSAYFSKSNKKRKLEDVNETSKENTSNIQLLQGSQDNVNLPSDVSMQFEGLLGKMESTVSVTNRAPMSSFNRVAVESVNNKNLQAG